MEASSTHLLGRQIQTITEVQHPKLRFSIMQWNTLAPCLAAPWKYPTIPEKYVHFDYRKDLITQEIRSYKADIICLEEVDIKTLDHFKSICDEKSYSMHFSKKNFGEDGACLFVKNTFQIVESESFSHTKSNGKDLENQVSHIVVLKNAGDKTDYYVIVAVAHFQAFVYLRWIRKRQAEQLASYLEKKKQKYSELLGDKSKNVAVVVCGDLNDVPDSSPIVHLTSNPKLRMKSVFDDMRYTVYVIPKLFSFEIPYKGTVDFILHTENLKVTKKLEGPTDEVIGNIGLPIAQFPSDHLSLFCEFVLE